jgi:hypothetical protein
MNEITKVVLICTIGLSYIGCGTNQAEKEEKLHPSSLTQKSLSTPPAVPTTELD